MPRTEYQLEQHAPWRPQLHFGPAAMALIPGTKRVLVPKLTLRYGGKAAITSQWQRVLSMAVARFRVSPG